jgi:hypothetical protein
MGVALTCSPLGTGALAAGFVSASFKAVAGLDAATGVGAAAVFSPVLIAAGADGEGVGLPAATNGFSPADPGGDGGGGWEDEAAGAGATEAGAAAGVPSLRKLSLYFGLSLASSAAGDAGAGMAGLSSVALAKEDGIPATGEGFVAGAGPEDGAAGAGAAVVGAAEGPSRNLSLMTGLAMAGADAETAGLSSVALAEEDGFSATGEGWGGGAGLDEGAAGEGAGGSSGLRGGDSSLMNPQPSNFPTKRNQKDSLAV